MKWMSRIEIIDCLLHFENNHPKLRLGPVSTSGVAPFTTGLSSHISLNRFCPRIGMGTETLSILRSIALKTLIITGSLYYLLHPVVPMNRNQILKIDVFFSIVYFILKP